MIFVLVDNRLIAQNCEKLIDSSEEIVSGFTIYTSKEKFEKLC